MVKIILFNGPPSCGKDTLANMIAAKLEADMHKVYVEKFAAPLKRAACAIYCNGDNALFAEQDLPQNKNKVNNLFFGKSCREVQIATSEVFLKQLHGSRVFGQLLASTIRQKSKKLDDIFLISDSGFRDEAEELVDQFGEGNVLLIKLFREGTTFEGDSRSYIDLSDLLVEQHEVTNENNNPVSGMQLCLDIINDFLEK